LQDPISKKPITKKGLVEWLKWFEALSSNPSAAKKKKGLGKKPKLKYQVYIVNISDKVIIVGD
jgi:hypothetical protein